MGYVFSFVGMAGRKDQQRMLSRLNELVTCPYTSVHAVQLQHLGN